MPGRCRMSAACLLVAVIGTVAMIGTIVKLKAQLAVTRQQCAIAYLVKAGAGVVRVNDDKGKYYNVHLSMCETCKTNDELLCYVADIDNVAVLVLAPVPLHEAGRNSLFRLKGLASISVPVTDTGISRESYAELSREMKLRNPDIFIQAADEGSKPLE